MSKSKQVVYVLPAYNAERTLENTLRDIPKGAVHRFILVDDESKEATSLGRSIVYGFDVLRCSWLGFVKRFFGRRKR